jgi:hypothetical protein
MVLTAVGDARAAMGTKEEAGLQIGSSVSVVGGVTLTGEILVEEFWAWASQRTSRQG